MKWEYYVIGLNIHAGDELINKKLNELGKKGWELISVVDNSVPSSSLRWQYCYFKKEIK